MALQTIPTLTQVKNWVNNYADVPHAEDAAKLAGQPPSLYGVPSGGIIMWSGEISEIPDGYYLCDGSNNTPDLTDRFVVGAGGQYTEGDTGGAAEVTLTEDEMPSHEHEMPWSHQGSGVSHTSQPVSGSSGYDQRSPSSGWMETAGGDEAHENRPPYFAVAYIMKA